MSYSEGQLKQLLNAAAGDPPRAIEVEAVRARARHQVRRLRVTVSVAAAILVAVAIGVPVVLTGNTNHRQTVISGGTATPTVVASPSQNLAPGQTVQVVLTGFPANQEVSLSECPTHVMTPSASCASAPAQTTLVTDRTGMATGRFVVQYASASFIKVFGPTKCAPTCLLEAISRLSPTAPAVTATTLLSFGSVPVAPPSTGNIPEPPGFGVAAASFVTANQGWALGSNGCSGCVAVVSTLDGGKSWTSLPTPPTTFWWYSTRPTAVTDIAFANASDGYLFAPGLFGTTDGGHSWIDEHLTGVQSVTIDGSYVYALTGYNGVGKLYRSLLGTTSWQNVPLPAVAGEGQSFQTVAAGSNLVLLETGLSNVAITAVQVGRIWISTDQGAHWQARSVPCTVADGGAAVVSVAFGHPEAWLVECYDNEQSSQEQDTLQHIYGTADAGQTWVRLGDPPQHNGPDLLADNGAGHAFLATEGGVGDTLNGTLDGGGTWTVSVRDGGSFYGWADLEFISTEVGFVVGPTHYATEHLYRTTDGGQTWDAVNVAP